jgi:type IX secretion system PorP/SprF family membrane protein
MVNPYFVNPAAAGPTTDLDLFVNYRKQWMGSVSPKTFNFSGSKMFVNGIAGGVIFSTDVTGAYSTSSAEMTGAYHVNISKNQAISFGLSLVGRQHVFDPSSIDVINTNDVVLNGGNKQAYFSPDASVGIVFSGKQYYFGISANQLFESAYDWPNLNSSQEHRSHVSLQGAYSFQIVKSGNEVINLTPNALFKSVFGATSQYQLGCMADLNEQVYFGLGSDFRSSFGGIVGLKWDQYRLWYAYDRNLNASAQLGSSSHELCMSYVIFRNKSGRFRNGQIRRTSLRL